MIVTNFIAKWIVGMAGMLNKKFHIVGVTIWPFIFFYPSEAVTARLILHEQKHLEQWKRYWIVGFLPVYIYQYIKYGYWEMPLEKEARAAEKK